MSITSTIEGAGTTDRAPEAAAPINTGMLVRHRTHSPSMWRHRT